MSTATKIPILSSLFWLALCSAEPVCKLSHCRPDVHIQFPFRLKGSQDRHCGYDSSFDLSCNSKNQTIITLKDDGEFMVESINYTSGSMSITDPDQCMPKRFIAKNFTINFPFRIRESSYSFRTFSFYNCTSWEPDVAPIHCLSGENYTIGTLVRYSRNNFGSFLSSCQFISTVSVPSRTENEFDIAPNMIVEWPVMQECQKCNFEGGVCGFNSNTGRTVRCDHSDSAGPTNGNFSGRGHDWVKIIGVVVLGILLVTWLIFYLFAAGALTNIHEQAYPSYPPNMELSISVPPVAQNIGLDRLAVDSYPVTFLSEIEQIPDLNDKTCPICLSEYQLGETIRTIPNCEHYFHTSCIDEWLARKATCPLCRNKQDNIYSLLNPNEPPWASMET